MNKIENHAEDQEKMLVYDVSNVPHQVNIVHWQNGDIDFILSRNVKWTWAIRKQIKDSLPAGYKLGRAKFNRSISPKIWFYSVEAKVI